MMRYSERDVPMTKYCPRCETQLPIAQFHCNRRMSDARAFYCRECMAKYAKEWYDRTQKPRIAARQQQREKYRERIRKRAMKPCSRCKKTLPCSAFSKHKDTLDGLQALCRQCSAEHQHWYYKENPDKHEQRKRRQSKWQRNRSPEEKKAARLRALLGRHGLSNEEELTAFYQACRNRCQVCNLHASEHMWKGLTGQLCVDHIVLAGRRLVRGLLCNRCNSLLGRMGDDRAGVMRYVHYLKRYEAFKKEKRNGRGEGLRTMQTV